jgi:hypothetical protein
VSETLRAATRSTIAPQDVYAAIHDAWGSLVGTVPQRGQILVLMAQQAFETGWWHYCWDYNLGNAKHVAGDGRDYCMIRLNEVIGGKVVWFDPPNPATWMRAFDSLSAGVVDYLALMRGQFGYAWPAVEAQDPAAFCHALKARGYFTDDVDHYTSNVLGCYHSLSLTIPPDAVPTAPELVADINPLVVPPDPDPDA